MHTNGRACLGGPRICRDGVEKTVAGAPSLCRWRYDSTLGAKIEASYQTGNPFLTDVTVDVPVQRRKLVTAAGLSLLWLTDASLTSEPERVLTG